MADVKIKLPDGFGDGMTGQEVTVTNAASEATLEKIVKQYEEKQPDKFTFGLQTPTVGLFTTTKAIESGLRIIEIPIVFKKRIGISKSGAFKKTTAFKFGWNFIWFILRN